MKRRRHRIATTANPPVLVALAIGSAAAAGLPWTADYSGQIDEVARFNLSPPASCLDVEGSLAYVGTFANGALFVVLDLSDPDNIVQLSATPVPDTVEEILVVGRTALVCVRQAGLFLFDVSDPSAPLLLGSVATPGYTRGVTLGPRDERTRYAFVACDWRGLCVVDLTDPTAPFVVAEIPTTKAMDVRYTDGTLYVADDLGGILVFNAKRPDALQPIATLPSPRAIEVDVLDDILYVGGWNSFAIFDVRDPGAPVELSRTPIGTNDWFADQVTDLWIQDGTAYLAAAGFGPLILDVSDPTSPVYLWGRSIYTTQGVERMGPYLVTAHGSSAGSVRLFDLRGSRSPLPVGFAAPSNITTTWDVAVSGSHAYAVSDSFRVYDVSDPEAPGLQGAASIYPRGTDVEWFPPSYAAVVVANKDFTVVDVGDPSAPQRVSTARVYAAIFLHGFDFAGSQALVGARVNVPVEAAVIPIDLSDPEAPVVGSVFLVPGTETEDVEVVGNLAYAATDAGLTVLDVTDPGAPQILSHAPIGYGGGVVVDGGLAFVAGLFVGLKIVDVSDPLQPVLISQFPDVGKADHVAVDGDFVYVVTGDGVEIVDVSDPTAPRWVGGTVVPPSQMYADRKIRFAGGLAYVAGNQGMTILPRHVPSGAPPVGPVAGPAGGSALAPPWPNPFREGTTLGFTATQRGPARMAIYDVTGRLVREVMVGTVGPGTHRIRWDGADGDGRTAAPGVYFVRLELEGRSSARKVQRIR